MRREARTAFRLSIRLKTRVAAFLGLSRSELPPPDLKGRGEIAIQSPDLTLDDHQAFPNVADARGDGFLEDFLDRIEG